MQAAAAAVSLNLVRRVLLPAVEFTCLQKVSGDSLWKKWPGEDGDAPRERYLVEFIYSEQWIKKREKKRNMNNCNGQRPTHFWHFFVKQWTPGIINHITVTPNSTFCPVWHQGHPLTPFPRAGSAAVGRRTGHPWSRDRRKSPGHVPEPRLRTFPARGSAALPGEENRRAKDGRSRPLSKRNSEGRAFEFPAPPPPAAQTTKKINWRKTRRPRFL